MHSKQLQVKSSKSKLKGHERLGKARSSSTANPTHLPSPLSANLRQQASHKTIDVGKACSNTCSKKRLTAIE
eukprot:3142528-Amphidinium_carterae.1